MRIPIEEVQFNPASQCDPNGRVFTWRGELFRGMSKAGAPLANRLFESGVVQALVEKRLLVESERTALQLDGFELVLKHRCLPVVSYPFEWSGSMLREALVLIADLQIELVRHGFEIDGNDADPWNVLFDACSPRWIDFGAIIPLNSNGPGSHEEFISRGIEPLNLLARGRDRLARWALQDFRPEWLADVAGFGALLPVNATRGVRGAVARRIRSSLAKWQGKSNTADARDFETWKKIIQRVQFPAEQSSSGNLPAGARCNERLAAMLSELRGESALLLGDRSAAYGEGAARIASHIMAFSETEADANALHGLAEQKRLNLQSLLIKAHNPSPGLGVVNRQFTPAIERLASDVVVASGLVENMFFERWLNFHQIAQTLSGFTRKWLLVEFVPAALLPPKLTADHSALEWYTPEEFKRMLRGSFQQIAAHEPDASGSWIFLCEK